LAKYPMPEKISKIGDQVYKLGAHPAVQQFDGKKELFLALLGFALVLHGAQFRNLLLCAQAVGLLLFDRVKASFEAVWRDVSEAHEKLKADVLVANGDGSQAEATAATAALADRTKIDVDVAKKALKVVDVERLSAAGMDILAAAVICILVAHGGLVQQLTMTAALVGLFVDRIGGILVFPGHEDIESWTRLLVRLSTWALVLPVAILFPSLTLMINAAVSGTHLVCKHGLKFMQAKDIIEDAEAFAASKQGLTAYGVLAVSGTLWQFWAWAVGSGMTWYFQVLYLPASMVEGILGLL